MHNVGTGARNARDEKGKHNDLDTRQGTAILCSAAACLANRVRDVLGVKLHKEKVL